MTELQVNPPNARCFFKIWWFLLSRDWSSGNPWGEAFLLIRINPASTPSTASKVSSSIQSSFFLVGAKVPDRSSPPGLSRLHLSLCRGAAVRNSPPGRDLKPSGLSEQLEQGFIWRQPQREDQHNQSVSGNLGLAPVIDECFLAPPRGDQAAEPRRFLFRV